MLMFQFDKRSALHCPFEYGKSMSDIEKPTLGRSESNILCQTFMYYVVIEVTFKWDFITGPCMLRLCCRGLLSSEEIPNFLIKMLTNLNQAIEMRIL